ncbi:MAG: NTP transferase domain-containing protein [Planctomycetes bacterium]|nr:NTP transferase domain-containing protein [Planctomycetota bacterium]
MTLTCVLPMAGDSVEFERAGLGHCRAMIDVDGRPAIERVIDNLREVADPDFFVCLVRSDDLRRDREHAQGLQASIERVTGGRCRIVPVENPTDGAAATALLAREWIDPDDELWIANVDQLVRVAHADVRVATGPRSGDHARADGLLLCFHDDDPRWSYTRIDGRGQVVEVAEKRVVSDLANCGIYYVRRAQDFWRATERMIAAQRTVRGVFFIAPVFQELVDEGRDVRVLVVEEMRSLGTPESVKRYRARAGAPS